MHFFKFYCIATKGPVTLTLQSEARAVCSVRMHWCNPSHFTGLTQFHNRYKTSAIATKSENTVVSSQSITDLFSLKKPANRKQAF